jgi:acetolactate synthase-1/2/3 large subunit
MTEFCAAARAMEPIAAKWAAATEAAHADYLAFSSPQPMPGEVNFSEIVGWLSDHLPEDAILTNGAGNYTAWIHRFFRHKQYGTQLGPQSGAMGYSVPAAVAAAVRHPDRIVVSFNGDGCFQMNGQEIGTAVQEGTRVIFLVITNGMYATIRMHQERRYPGRVSGTDLVNPDFAALARAYGASGETVVKTEEFAPAFERARAASGPALIELVIDPEAILPTATLSGLRDQARDN